MVRNKPTKMKTIKQYYYYLFYNFYLLFEAAPSRWLSYWKATAAMTILAVYIFAVFEGYFLVITKIDLFSENAIWIMVLVGASAGLLNYFIFIHDDQWQIIITIFDDLSMKKRRLGRLLFLVFIMFVFFSLVYMFYLMSKIDWSNK